MILRNMGLKLLGVWLILSAILPFLKINVPFVSYILALLALFAGVLILVGR